MFAFSPKLRCENHFITSRVRRDKLNQHLSALKLEVNIF